MGEDRKAYIEAERYNQEIDNDSSFLWMEGSNFIEEETIETEEMQSEYYSSFGMDTNGYTEKFHDWQMRIESAWTRSPLQRKMERNRQNKF